MVQQVGLVRVVTPGEINRQEQATAAQRTALNAEQFKSQLATHFHKAFRDARNHREAQGITTRLLQDLRTYRGQYEAVKLQEISQFSGSKVYSRLTAVKCRGASSILRDIYLSNDRPWVLEPTPEPDIPGDVASNVVQLVTTEVQTLQQGGQPIDPLMIEDRVRGLMDAAKKAEKRNAKKEAAKASSHLEDLLVEGGFYRALSEFLIDLPIFLFAAIKGPVVRQHTTFKWQPDGSKKVVTQPKMYWERVSPFDVYFTASSSSIEHTTVFERVRLKRSELYDLIGLPGYDEPAIRRVLEDMNSGASNISEWASYFEAQRADLENREDTFFATDDSWVDSLEIHGYVRGQWLLDWGMTDAEIPDADKEYFVTAWLISNEVIKVQLDPNPRQRPNYYVTSFEKIPGSIYGSGLPEILSDIQDVANATLRALVNNLAIASGPQVIVDDERSAPGADTDSLYPWKRWHITSDPYGSPSPPISFFQPNSNSNELLGVYKEFTNMADEISAIPRYLTGSQRTGGAASTASGLAMLMNNASKVMQNVAANIDEDILTPMITTLYDMVMLTDPGVLRGDENIIVKGVTNAIQREQDRVRQLEFLNMTANPIDMQLVGMKGRASVLRAVATGLGLDYEDTVADDEALQEALAQQAAAQSAPPGGMAPNPDTAKSSGAPPRTNRVSNVSTV